MKKLKEMSSNSKEGGAKSIEEIYQKKSQLEHILLRPDTYIGSIETTTNPMWIYENDKLVYCTAIFSCYQDPTLTSFN